MSQNPLKPKTASTSPSPRSEKNADTSRATGQADSPDGFSSEEYQETLISLIKRQDEPFNLAKIVVVDAKGNLPREVEVFGIEQATALDTKGLRVCRILAYCKDIIPMDHYKTHDALGQFIVIPWKRIRGFQWCRPEEEGKYLDIHGLEDPN